MAERDPFDWLGHTIDGRFEVTALAGEGGFGVVYRAHHKALNVPVAIKCLKVPKALVGQEREKFERRFTEEGRVLHRLSKASAAVVQALDVGAATSPSGAWTPYIVLEWLDGRALDIVIEQRKKQGLRPFSIKEAVRLLTPSALALAEAHEQRVAHRDVKPANLFLAKVGDREVLKVLDFGIAKVVQDSLSQSEALRMTGQAPRAFTPQYGAPEQFDRRKGATGPWTDVHALALVLVELVVGRPAFEGDDVVQLMACALDPTIRPTPGALGADVEDEVDAVLERALAVRPEDRFADARAFWTALERAVDGVRAAEPEPDARESPLLSTSEFLAESEAAQFVARRGLETTARASTTGAIIAESAPALATASTGAATANDPATARTTRRSRLLAAALGAALLAAGYGVATARRQGLDHYDARARLASPASPESAARTSDAAASAAGTPSQVVPVLAASSHERADALMSGTAPSAKPRERGGLKPSGTPPAASATDVEELGPEACGSDCTIQGMCTPKVIAQRLVCRATSDADCRKSYLGVLHGAVWARKGVCVALTQVDCDASQGCMKNSECRLNHGTCMQARYDTDADCRPTPGCTRTGRCTAKENGCIATNAADCEGSATCKSDGVCRFAGGACVK